MLIAVRLSVGLCADGTTSEIEYRDPMQDDPQRRRPNITRAREHIGWQPRVSLLPSLLILWSGVNKTIADND